MIPAVFLNRNLISDERCAELDLGKALWIAFWGVVVY